MGPHHLPFYLAPGSGTDVLMVVMGVFLIAALIWVGTLYLRLHSLPERMAHKSEKLQFEIVAILGLLALFTHIHLFWVAGLLLAMIDIAGSVEKIADTVPNTPTEAEQEASLAPAPVPPDTAKGGASKAKRAGGGHV
jgi:prepilin signal peptidase PulO-like enzyme (type II secretory pathway)